jgi:hypothetical protein
LASGDLRRICIDIGAIVTLAPKTAPHLGRFPAIPQKFAFFEPQAG